MKFVNMLVFIITGIVILVNSKKNDHTFLPNLPIGEYRVNYKAISKCNLNPNSVIQQNYYFNKILANVTELKGNLTLLKPFDDSFTVHFICAVKDTIGGWKDNAHVFKLPNACSSFKHFMGTYWDKIGSSLGLGNCSNCPLPPGVYNLNNLILYSAPQTHFPKSFFYGTYKVRIFFTDNLNNQHGCIAYIIDVKRPWEMD